ncbi:hypothetical protein [Butyrivibrio sp. AC2005]|uniref:hypothetical protein n=1 Tax=Butyrivibrio sp. AC2005 TaxID=1280672 RepID=UPI00047E87F5|nr:hypothetical protein [Butyrivibrio sp. AC2005]
MRKSYSSKYCGTCKNWCGKQKSDTINRMVDFDDNEKAKCSAVNDGALKRGGTQTSCSKWAQRF